MNFEALFDTYKEAGLYGRYIPLSAIEPILNRLNANDHQLAVIGQSVLGRPIYSYQIGSGKTKILLWSQMHGNESTTTKALFDFLNFMQSEAAANLLQNFTFLCLPMLNPDGSEVYTRENANGVDLNRDAANLSQPESIALRTIFNSFKPDFCFNLHDQRTIYGAGESGKPATVSFLAPSYNEDRETNAVRSKAMHVISAMSKELQKYIPGQVGRFDDGFNINCVGDTFQFLNVPTILFEAGHYHDDYAREQTRKFIFIAFLSGLNHINENVIVSNEIHDYLNIPQNKLNFYDFVYKNISVDYDSNKIITNFAIQFKEELVNNQICFNACFAEIGDLENRFGHFEYDARGSEFTDGKNNIPELEQKADFCLDINIKVVNGRVNS